jgi:trehalose 6-phosphate phosphatase
MLERVVTAFGGAVALLTGRRLADADRLLAPLRLAGSGVHGTELRAERGGSIQMLAAAVPPGLAERITRVSELSPGILVEQKGAGMAVHYRNAPDMRDRVIAELQRIATDSPYEIGLRRGRKVVEAIPLGFSKATALNWFVKQPSFRGRLPIMIGDDVGDECAFAAAERLGGLGLRVAGEHFAKESSFFSGVDDVHAWLEDLADQCELSLPRVRA